MNGGSWAEAIVQVDEWIGQIIAEVERLGIADNTIIMAMGDNGTMTQYMGLTGASDRVYRGGKGEHLEGGVRVNAFIRWPGVIERVAMLRTSSTCQTSTRPSPGWAMPQTASLPTE